MADVQNKTVTVESLAALHEYNKNTYVTQTEYAVQQPLSVTLNAGYEYDIINEDIPEPYNGMTLTIIPDVANGRYITINGGNAVPLVVIDEATWYRSVALNTTRPYIIIYSTQFNSPVWVVNDTSLEILQMTNGGTGATNGAIGLANLFASGETILSSYQYGDELPEAGHAGRIFFKRLTDI